MASYITQNGERRTTISVRLSDDELAQLDELRDGPVWESLKVGRFWAARPSRGEAIKWALKHARGVL